LRLWIIPQGSLSFQFSTRFSISSYLHTNVPFIFRLIFLLFLFGCSFETVQTLKDYEEDKKFGLTTDDFQNLSPLLS
jgi:4-hydroxybenzoate polyprenyltransferase